MAMKAMCRSRRLPAFVLLAALAASASAQEHKAKSALDDRPDPNANLAEVGKGTHMARQPLKPGAYFNSKTRAAVRAYYAAHPLQGVPAANAWQIGHTMPAGASPLPPELLAKLPKLPPGHLYVQLSGDVLLVAAGSKMVVDAIDAQAK
jgi:hypothetical protein